MNPKALISENAVLIGYTPLSDEVDYRNLDLFRSRLRHIHFISPDPQSDPYATARGHIESFGVRKVGVIIPGQQFDVFGNRKGRGGGWYDRYLTAVPQEWSRIGIAQKTRVSLTRLEIQSWDEPMDWIVTIGPALEILETRARNKIM